MSDSSAAAARELRRNVKRQGRGRGRASRKDAVLHLRIEADIMKRIKSEAKASGVGISDLVRRHLAEHFRPNHSSGDSSGLNSRGAPDFIKDTYAWTEIVLAKETRCAVCNSLLAAGDNAHLPQGPPPPAKIVCDKCHGQLVN